MDNLFLSIETALYLPILLTIISKIGEYKITRKVLIIIDIFLIVSLLIASTMTDDSVISIFCMFVHIVHILILYLATPKLRLLTLIAYLH